MTFQDRLKKARKNAALTQRTLADKLGLKHNAISNWEHGHSKPDLVMLGRICSILDVSINYMLDQPTTLSANFTEHEINIIDRYRAINSAGKTAIDAMLTHLYTQMQATAASPPVLEVISGRMSLQSAAAGFGVYLDEESFDNFSVAKNRLTQRASFYVPVSGNSMEPKYYDGDILIIEDSPVLQGEIGLFTLDGNGYVKKLGKNELLSLNPDYSPIPIEEEIICNGKVIGVLEPDWIVEQ